MTLSQSKASATKICTIGKSAIMLESKGLQQLADSLDDTFVQVINLLDATRGRVIVSGIGKSGHIARKLAATLSSTGTPSYFVHPAEASHGDLGMVSSGDTVMILSNSGETNELLDLVVYSQRHNIPLIAITQSPQSALAKSACCVLTIPKVEEACPMGLAPTTSTTLMLALGDALAVTLLEKKGFTSHDYHTFHPGGSLGRRLFRVRDLMHSGESMPLVTQGMLMQDALVEMTRKTFGCVGVMGSPGITDGLIGVITDGDLRRHMQHDLLNMLVDDVMNPAPKTISSEALAVEAFEYMRDNKITSLFAVENETVSSSQRPLGILHIHDLLRAKIV